MVTEEDKNCILNACKDYKRSVGQLDHNGEPGLNDKYSIADFYNIVMSNIDDFRIFITDHHLLEKYGYKTIKQAYDGSYGLFMYGFQDFINNHIYQLSSLTTSSPINIQENGAEEKKNKKEFIKEVMEGIELKKTLKDFLDDNCSYKQFQRDIRNVALYLDFDKIHQVMEDLDWKWASWDDDMGETHYDEVPTVYALREEVIHRLDEIEKYINTHPEDDCYFSSTGGFDYNILVCGRENGEPDDYEHRVRLIVRFVIERYDNGM